MEKQFTGKQHRSLIYQEKREEKKLTNPHQATNSKYGLLKKGSVKVRDKNKNC
jgi:hypothetical protein